QSIQILGGPHHKPTWWLFLAIVFLNVYMGLYAWHGFVQFHHMNSLDGSDSPFEVILVAHQIRPQALL
ncbi:hypothetical protein PJP10_32650, partial [Mycobacterium kansasii]